MANHRSLVAGAAAIALAFILLVTLALSAAVSSTATTTSPGSLNTAGVPAAARRLVPWLEQAGSLCPQITAPLLAAQIQQESGWNPNAVSPSGAEGIAQFLPATWPAWSRPAATTGPDTPFNPADAIVAQGRYMCALAAGLANLAASTGIDVVSLALAAYNAGVAAVIAAGGIPNNGQTPNYVARILADEATYTLVLVSAAAGTPLGLAIVTAAATQLGVAYSWGGGTFTGPSLGSGSGAGTVGFDCSGLVLYALYQASGGRIRAPHSAATQSTMGTAVTKNDIAPGDTIGFALDGGTDITHIGIYLGDNKMIDAPDTGGVVRVDDLDTSYWQNIPWTIRAFG